MAYGRPGLMQRPILKKSESDFIRVCGEQQQQQREEVYVLIRTCKSPLFVNSI